MKEIFSFLQDSKVSALGWWVALLNRHVRIQVPSILWGQYLLECWQHRTCGPNSALQLFLMICELRMVLIL